MKMSVCKNRPAEDDSTSHSVEFSFDYVSRVEEESWVQTGSRESSSSVRGNQKLKSVSGSLSF